MTQKKAEAEERNRDSSNANYRHANHSPFGDKLTPRIKQMAVM